MEDREASPLLVLPSATPSETSPSKPMPELSADNINLPEWDNHLDAVSWFIHLRQVVRNLMYRYGATIQRVLQIFEENDAEEYAYYKRLKSHLRTTWIRWKEFIGTKTISTTFLMSSVIYDNLGQVTNWMRTPPSAPRRSGREMAELRSIIQDIVVEMARVSGRVSDAAARLEDVSNGYPVATFASLPAPTTLTPAEEIRVDTVTYNLEKTIENVPPTTEVALDVEDDAESIDENDKLIIENGVRNKDTLEEHGFDPIWTSSGGYPGKIPDEISEYLDEHGKRWYEIVGSNRSIFWLNGYVDIVEAIDDPACAIEDEVVCIPQGADAVGFLLGHRYWLKDKIPRTILKRLDGQYFRLPATLTVAPVFQVPSGLEVGQAATQRRIADMYPLSRCRQFPEAVPCLRVKHHKANNEKTVTAMINGLRGVVDTDADNVWFRGLDLTALGYSLTFFLPVIKTSNFDNEFGPGIYATSNIAYATKYATPNGAIMVFKNPDLRELTVWRPEPSEWNTLTATWLNIPLSNLSMPEQHSKADVFIGSITKDAIDARERKAFPKPGELTQMACVSYEGCKRLAASLAAIVYITP